jgi:multidrug efflux pump subunit AcrA (membrane-fusion protein)
VFLRGSSKSEIALAACLVGVAGGAYAVGTIVGFWTAGQPTVRAEGSKPLQAVAALGRIEPQSEIINLGAGTASPDRLEQLYARVDDRILNIRVKPGEDVATGARVIEVWIDLDDAAAVERLTNLTADVVIDRFEHNTPLAHSGSP